MRILEASRAGALLAKLARRGALDTARVEPTVRRIVADVRARGDRALRQYGQKYDGLTPRQPLAVSQQEMERAWDETPLDLQRALQTAADNIRRFAEWQRPHEWRREVARGACVGQIARPLAAVGCYVPGGRYPLPSTLLMTVIPAQVAGVERIVVTSPRPARETLASAALLGVREFYRVGGAQAIAALAYGTKTLPAVDKIVGPGNLYVTTAKKLVAFDCAIDFLAGPTEAVVAATAGDARFLAADLVAQAEHDPDALPIFVTTSRDLARAVAAEVSRQAEDNPIAQQAITHNGVILLARSRKEMMKLVNQLAPEHLSIERELLAEVQNAGSVFVGEWSPQAAGDYCSGPNHVLPTGGMARVRGGLSTLDFIKLISVQEISREGLAALAPTVTRLAGAEGLRAHAAAVRIRTESSRARSSYA